MQKLVILTIIYVCILSDSFSKESDTLSSQLPEIQVNGSRFVSNPGLLFSPYSQISQEEIAKKGALQVSEVLAAQPGIFIKNYGGLGGLKTVSMRGTSAQSTLFMLNGVKLNSSQNGIIDLSTLPINIFEVIEVAKGGTSAFYGGNAISGAINFITKSDLSKSSVSAKFNYGSFNEIFSGLSVALPIGKASLLSSVEYLSSKGNYPFEVDQFGKTVTLNRENGDFKNLSFFINSTIPINNWNLGATFLLRQSDRGSPGAVLQNHVESANARLNELDGLLILNSKHIISNNNSIKVNFSFRKNSLKYKDPDAYGGFRDR